MNWTPAHPEVQRYISNLLTPWKQFVFMFTKLPGAMFFGIRVKILTPANAAVTLPYRWSTKNPFRSIYFAAQCAAGELATGILVMLALQGRASASILVSQVRAEFTKKANSLITFTCHQGQEVIETVEKVIAMDDAQTITMMAVGNNDKGEEVSKIYITWTIKKRPSLTTK
ncbi:MAG: DUF4442 domain-containing protein [Saprospiraceae bacterium]|nr:DUF4442 domain-containing protein [Saprospiraceae bacterium]